VNRLSDIGRWERHRLDGHYLVSRPAPKNRWGVPLRQWRAMPAWEQQEVIDYELHPRREGRDELADHRREGRGEWRPLVRERA
jgi:hypothetical protein